MMKGPAPLKINKTGQSGKIEGEPGKPGPKAAGGAAMGDIVSAIKKGVALRKTGGVRLLSLPPNSPSLILLAWPFIWGQLSCHGVQS